MSNSFSTVFLSPPPRIIPHTPPSLSATPSPSPQPVCRLALASLDSTDPDPNGEQSRLTMQTRVAVRDATPHRFQIIPLREHKLSNIPDTNHGRSNEPRYRSHELMRPAGFQQIPISEPLSRASHAAGTDKLLSVSSAHSLCVPQVSAFRHEPIVLPSPDTQIPIFVHGEKRAATIPPSEPLPHRIKPENTLYAPFSHEHRNSPSMSAILPLSSEYPDILKPYQTNVKSNIVVQDTFNGSYFGSATGKIKCRVCSEVLTHCRDQKCTHGHFCLRCPCGDSSWHTTVTVMRRHAIYTDALVLPIISRGSSPRQIWRAPVARNRKADQPSRIHHAVPRYSRGASNHTSDKGLRVATGMVFSAQSEKIVRATEDSCQVSPQPVHFIPPVSHLRLFKKTRHLSTSGASSTREGFAKQSNTVFELIAQLDQAIRDWKELERDHAVLCTTVQGSRL